MQSAWIAGGMVSIHAPVKGATVSYHKGIHIFFVSIHAPVKGATDEPSHPPAAQSFQFTLP